MKNQEPKCKRNLLKNLFKRPFTYKGKVKKVLENLGFDDRKKIMSIEGLTYNNFKPLPYEKK